MDYEEILFIVGIIAMIVIIIIFLVYGITYYKEYDECRHEESPFCMTITCPFDDTSNNPCNGYVFKTYDDETFYCQFNPQQGVDISGDPVS